MTKTPDLISHLKGSAGQRGEPLGASVNPDFLSTSTEDPNKRFFGMEIEVGESYLDADIITKALHAAKISPNSSISGYHAGRRSGYHNWRAEFDSSVEVEVVSPTMADNSETWGSVNKVCEVLRMFGAITSDSAGNHVHISAKPEEVPYVYLLAWLFQDTLEAVAALPTGERRDSGYAEPLSLTDVERAVRGNGVSRYRAVNRPHNLPTMEFRLPEASYNIEHLKANVLVSSLVVQKAEELLAAGIPLPFTVEGMYFELWGSLSTTDKVFEGIRLLARTTGQADLLKSQVAHLLG